MAAYSKLFPPPQQNQFNQRDQYSIRVCYRMAQADLRKALALASSIIDVPSRAYALGVIAHAAAKTDPKQAADLVRRAFVLRTRARPRAVDAVAEPRAAHAALTRAIAALEKADSTGT